MRSSPLDPSKFDGPRGDDGDVGSPSYRRAVYGDPWPERWDEDVTQPEGSFWRHHRCGGCGSGKRPCREGGQNRCGWPRARND